MKIGNWNFQIIRHTAEAAAARQLEDSPAFTSGRLVLPTGGEYYQLLPKLTPTQIRAWLYAWLQGDWTSGYDLMQVMLDTWPRARKNLHEVREAAATARFTVHPAALDGEEPTATAIERADFVRQQLGRFNPAVATDERRLQGFLYDATDALVMGVSLNELLWDRHADGSAFVRATAYVSPRRIGYTASHKLGLRYPSTSGIVAPGFTPSPGPAQELAELRFVLAQYQTCSGAATKQSILRTLVWWWGSMIWGRDWMLKFAEQFGLPWVDVAYDRNINPADLAAMKAGAATGGVNTYIFRPTDATIKLIESQKNGKDNPQMAMIDYADHCADLVILGQTGTGDAKQSSGRAQVQALAGIRRERVQAVANWLGSDAGCQLTGVITEVNYGDREEAPVLVADFTEPEEPLAMAERDQVVVATVPVPKNWYYLRHNIPVPKAGEETIGGPPPSTLTSQPPANISGAAAAEQKVETELDAMRARLARLEASNDNRGKTTEGTNDGSYAPSASAKIGKLYDDAMTGGIHRGEEVGKVSEHTANLVKKELGVDIAGHKLLMETHAIVHADNRHGQSESNPKQVPLTKEDYQKIPDVVNNAETAEPGNKPNRILLSKRVNGTIFTVQHDRRADQSLAFVTAWKTKAEGVHASNGLDQTSNTPIGTENLLEAGRAVNSASLQSQVASLQSALSSDLAPFTAKYSTLNSQLSTSPKEPMAITIQLRRDTSANWTSANPTLAAGEAGFETNTGKFKIGTGSTAWNTLPYAAVQTETDPAFAAWLAGVVPAVPTGLTATAISATRIDLAWDSMTGATSYNIYRGGTLLTNVSTNSYSNTGLTASTLYSYTVAAVNGFGASAPCTAATATTAAAITDTALQFDGSQNYVMTPSDSITIPSSDYTVELWFKSNSVGAQSLGVLGMMEHWPSGWWLVLNENGDSGNSNYLQFGGNTFLRFYSAVSDAMWHHIALVQSSGITNIFVDGNFVVGAAGSYLAITSGLGIGGVIFGKTHGTIDEVQLSNIARYTAAFVPQPILGTDANTVAYWKFNEGTGLTATDCSGNGHDGTLTGSPLPTWVDGCSI